MTTSTFILITALIIAIFSIAASIDRFTNKVCRKADEFLTAWERNEKRKREQK